MISAKYLRPISSIIIMVYFASCTTTYEVTRRSELDNPDDLGEITVRTKDEKEYELKYYVLKDSTLNCVGTVETDGLKKSFKGKLNLSDIKQIEATKTDWGKTILITGAGSVVLLTSYIFWAKQDDGLRNHVVVKYPSGGGCNGISNNFHHNNESKLNAAGLKEMLDIKSIYPNKVTYFNIVSGSETFLFEVVNDKSRIEIEMVDELPEEVDNSDTLTIYLDK
ncbi:hypothetical protein ACFLSV_02310 [Bacteroidota bacterium]